MYRRQNSVIAVYSIPIILYDTIR